MSEKYSVITGGTGYVGLALVKYLVGRGEKVRLLLLEDHPCLETAKSSTATSAIPPTLIKPLRTQKPYITSPAWWISPAKKKN